MAKKQISKRAPRRKSASDRSIEEFEVQFVRLLTSASQLKITGNPKESTNLTLNFTVSLNEGKKEKIVLVNAGCNVGIHAGKEPDEQCTKVSAVFQVVFNAKTEFPLLDEDDRKRIVVTGSVIAWPYLRSFIQMHFASMGLPPFILPLFHPAQSGATIGRFADVDVPNGKNPSGSSSARKRKQTSKTAAGSEPE